MSKQKEKAAVLAFERKIDVSDALFHAGKWDDRENGSQWPVIDVREKAVRGTISHYMGNKKQDPGKFDASIEKPNLQTVDVATLPADADTLRVRFTIRVLGGAGTPSACNNATYQQKLAQTVTTYVGEHGFGLLARRYAHNLANGRFLWRNRMSAEQVEVGIRHMEQGDVVREWIFQAMDFSLRDFEDNGNQDIASMAEVIEQGLSGDKYILLEVIAYARMGDGQEVFPSQEFVREEKASVDNRAKGMEPKYKKSKVLYEVDGGAAMHSQKLGNAIRTIDTWYPDSAGLGPIPVETYGSVTSQGRAYRQPKQKADFYNLLDNWVLRDKAPAPGDQHYVMATLIRGGVFGEKD